MRVEYLWLNLFPNSFILNSDTISTMNSIANMNFESYIENHNRDPVSYIWGLTTLFSIVVAPFCFSNNDI